MRIALGLLMLLHGFAHLMGALWLLSALAFTLAAVGALTIRSWWVNAAVTAAIGSILLSVLAWPEARIGVALNLLILGALILGVRAHWL
jgi:hypothetical protein